ncbi:hypothetical protein HY643_04715 [Candidatus Woesearchaeota archaeon]|nr:hypothetical protein [Candidatus Woesearchaeota archaeon]
MESTINIKKRTILIAVLILIVIAVLALVAERYLPSKSVAIRSGEEAKDEIAGMSQELEDLSSTIGSVDEELK